MITSSVESAGGGVGGHDRQRGRDGGGLLNETHKTNTRRIIFIGLFFFLRDKKRQPNSSAVCMYVMHTNKIWMHSLDARTTREFRDMCMYVYVHIYSLIHGYRCLLRLRYLSIVLLAANIMRGIIPPVRPTYVRTHLPVGRLLYTAGVPCASSQPTYFESRILL